MGKFIFVLFFVGQVAFAEQSNCSDIFGFGGSQMSSLEKWRISKKMNRQDIARKLRINLMDLDYIENNGFSVRLENLLKYVKTLDGELTLVLMNKAASRDLQSILVTQGNLRQLGDFLKQRRENLGITKASIVREISIVETTVDRLERNPGSSSLSRLTEYLGILGIKLIVLIE